MALSKQHKSYLLVATLVVAGLTIGGLGLHKINDLNNKVESLMKDKTKLERTIDSMDKDIKDKINTIDNITKERDNIKESHDKIKKEKDSLEYNNKVLKQKLEAKKKESSAVAVASAEYPTQAVSRGRSVAGTPVTMTLTFYGDGADENGGYAGMNAYSQKLTAGTVASNVYPRGTKFKTPDGRILTVNDRGGKAFKNYNRLDVFVPRKPGESNTQYKQRINNLGKKTVTLYKI